MTSWPEATDQFCWIAIRSFWKSYSEQKLQEFAAEHQEETFYCLCVYFDSVYGDFFLYLNVPEQARQTAIQLKQAFPDLHGHQTVEEVEAELKWDCGDFRYSFINDDTDWKRFWEPIKRLFEDLGIKLFEDSRMQLFPGEEDYSKHWFEKFAETACLVALDLERSDVLNLFRKTDDFRVICVDHDEKIEDSDARLNRVRERYFPLL